MSARLTESFFDRHHLDVARDLIGCRLVWGGVRGRVVETEGYAADDDPACHTSSRPTARAFFEQNRPGTAYVYLSYGVHWMLNVLAGDGIVLFRALEPLDGLSAIRRRRKQQRPEQLCSGPGRLGQALALGPQDHGCSLVSPQRHLRARTVDFDPSAIRSDLRVGLSLAWDRPWRFLEDGNRHVSVRLGRTAPRRRRRRRRQTAAE